MKLDPFFKSVTEMGWNRPVIKGELITNHPKLTWPFCNSFMPMTIGIIICFRCEATHGPSPPKKKSYLDRTPRAISHETHIESYRISRVQAIATQIPRFWKYSSIGNKTVQLKVANFYGGPSLLTFSVVGLKLRNAY